MIILETGMLATMSVIVGMLIAIPINYWFQEHGIPLKEAMDIGGVKYDRMLGVLSLRSLMLPAVVTWVAAVAISVWPAVRAARMKPVDALCT
jgi:ABC-type lipoprotein release transport system permease subunit